MVSRADSLDVGPGKVLGAADVVRSLKMQGVDLMFGVSLINFLWRLLILRFVHPNNCVFPRFRF